MRFEPDEDVVYTPGMKSWVGAAGHFLSVATSRQALGSGLALLAVLGLGVLLARRESRWYGLLVLIPCGAFAFVAVTAAAYHTEPRHLNAVYPLLATLVWPGASLLISPLDRVARRGRIKRGRGRPGEGAIKSIALALVAAAAVPSALASAAHGRAVMRADSRLAAWQWLQASLPRDARILLDDYGPPLQPDARAAARLERRLAALPPGPFTEHQAVRLRLLKRHPPAGAFDVEELGHPWWLPREKTDAALAASAVDRDMGNPLTSRQPRPLAEYRRSGIRYVVTNSTARSRYFRPVRRAEAFPSFVRFYEELAREARLVATFDPRAWDGKGPVVWVYAL